MTHIERLNPDEYTRLRDIRLRSLKDWPDAFGRTFEEEASKPTSFWQNRLNSGTASYIAVLHGKDVGIAFGADYQGKEGASGLFGMWVAPIARGKGCGDALVQKVIDWSNENGFRRLLLDVANDNPHAIALYARMGFEPTGVQGTLPAPRTHITEHERERKLTTD